MYSDHGIQLSGVEWVLANILMVLMYPAVLISNVTLLIVIFANYKIRNDPSKWPIAHTSMCMFIEAFLTFIKYFSTVYAVPSLVTTPLCPGVEILIVLLIQIVPMSFTLSMVERCRVALNGNYTALGMTKLAVIITLAVFWLFNIIIHVTSFLLANAEIPLFVYSSSHTGRSMCYMSETPIAGWATLVVAGVSVLSIVVINICLIIIGCKRSDPALNKNVIIPSVILGFNYVLFSHGPHFTRFVLFDLFIYWPHIIVIIMLTIADTIPFLAFPVTWLIVWTLNGDFTWNFKLFNFRRPTGQEFQLFENIEHTPADEVS